MENNIGGARLVGRFRFGGGRERRSSVIPCCINAGDFARGARDEIIFINHGGR